MSRITTHILDTSLGKPARNVAVTLTNFDDEVVGRSQTDQDGRVKDLMSADVQTMPTGRYRLSFDVATYFNETGRHCFYPVVHIDFEVDDPAQHYHVPLLISPFGYSTYRGS